MKYCFRTEKGDPINTGNNGGGGNGAMQTGAFLSMVISLSAVALLL